MISKPGDLKKSLYSILFFFFCHFHCFLGLKPIRSKILHVFNEFGCAIAVLLSSGLCIFKKMASLHFNTHQERAWYYACMYLMKDKTMFSRVLKIGLEISEFGLLQSHCSALEAVLRFIWVLCELRTYKWSEDVITAVAFKQSQIKPGKCFRRFNGIRTRRLCVSAAVVHQLSYEDPYLGNRQIYWPCRTCWKEWNIWVLCSHNTHMFIMFIYIRNNLNSDEDVEVNNFKSIALAVAIESFK